MAVSSKPGAGDVDDCPSSYVHVDGMILESFCMLAVGLCLSLFLFPARSSMCAVGVDLKEF